MEFKCKVRECVQQVFYQWYKDGQELHGEENSSLILNPLKVKDFGFYKCEVRSDKRDDSICGASQVEELDVTPAEGTSELIYDCPELHWTVSYMITYMKKSLDSDWLRKECKNVYHECKEV